MPKFHSLKQKEIHFEIAQDMLEYANNDSDFLKTLMTIIKSWVYEYNPESKTQSSQGKIPIVPRQKKARRMRNKMKVKVTLIVFSTTAELCIRNSHQKPKLPSTVQRLYIFVKQFGTRDQTWNS